VLALGGVEARHDRHGAGHEEHGQDHHSDCRLRAPSLLKPNAAPSASPQSRRPSSIQARCPLSSLPVSSSVALENRDGREGHPTIAPPRLEHLWLPVKPVLRLVP
jgi:hypothetical protein